jgi:hypothetical protein
MPANATPVQRFRLFAEFTTFSLASRITSESRSLHSQTLQKFRDCGGRLRRYSPLPRNSANLANRSSHSTSSSASRAECESAATLVGVRPSSTCSFGTILVATGRMVCALSMGALCCAYSVHCSNVICAEKFPTVPTSHFLLSAESRMADFAQVTARPGSPKLSRVRGAPAGPVYFGLIRAKVSTSRPPIPAVEDRSLARRQRPSGEALLACALASPRPCRLSRLETHI